MLQWAQVIATPFCLQEDPQLEKTEEKEDGLSQPVEKPMEESLDSRGIPGWNRVDKLAHALISLSGLSVTNTQAGEIKKLYEDLLPYDKKPLQFELQARKPSRGWFARSKGGHVGIDQMKR